MRAAGVRRFGGPEALELLDLDEPHAGPGEIRIKVAAAAVNPTDTALRAGSYGSRLSEHFDPPYVPGMDAAGVVDEVGPGVSGVVAGDEVMAIVLPTGSRPTRANGGAYAEYVVVPERSAVPVPAGSDLIAAATLPMNALTARVALDLLDLPAGATIAVTGAAGAFGGYVIQLAKQEGLRVIADASEADEALVYELGADEVVRRGYDVAERILEIAPGGVAGIADGAVLDDRIVPAVKDGGGLATVRFWNEPTPRGVRVHVVTVGSYALEREKLDRLRQQVEDGVLTLRVARSYPVEQAAEAHRVLEAGGTRGRLVLTF